MAIITDAKKPYNARNLMAVRQWMKQKKFKELENTVEGNVGVIADFQNIMDSFSTKVSLAITEKHTYQKFAYAFEEMFRYVSEIDAMIYLQFRKIKYGADLKRMPNGSLTLHMTHGVLDNYSSTFTTLRFYCTKLSDKNIVHTLDGIQHFHNCIEGMVKTFEMHRIA